MTNKKTEILRCPVCMAPMEATEKSLLCLGEKRHCFDFSKSGYLNFSLSGKLGDTLEATKARSFFLEQGYYQPLSDRLEVLLREYNVKSFIDAGCGEGYYTNRIVRGRTGFGVDLSKSGIDHAAKVAKREETGASFLVGSLFELPFAEESVDAVLNLFAPCSETEFLRVLRPGGLLILVGAGENHLMGLKKVLYETTYQNPGRADLPKVAKCIHSERLQGKIEPQGQESIQALFSMTPYYWRTSPKDREKLLPLETLSTEFDFDIRVYQK